MDTRTLILMAIFSAPVFAQGSTSNILVEENPTTAGVQFQFQRDYNSPSFMLVAQSYDWEIITTPGDHWVMQLPKPGFSLSRISCDLSSKNSSVKFYKGGPTQTTIPTASWSAGDDSVAIHLATGDTVECQFTDQAIGPQTCTADNQCSTSQICMNGQCVTGCRVDSTCPTGDICTSGQCVVGCRVDSTCPNGDICTDGQCVVGCRANSDCPSGQICNLSNLMCETPPAQCTIDTQCPSGEICTNGQCVVGCRANSDCPAGLICNLSTLMCETPPPQCTIDTQCPSGKICTNGQCVTGCRVDSTCPTGDICTSGQCVVGCRANSDCPSGQICNLSTLMCETPPPQCTIDTQCPSGEICTNGQCVTGCRVDRTCPTGEICTEGQCVVGCRANSDCPAGQICNLSNLICETPPPQCTIDTQCPSGKICTNGQCVTGCRGDSTCPKGDICTNGQCVVGCRANSDCPNSQICNLSTLMCETPPPQCTIDTQCPSGKICTNGQCVTGCHDDSTCAKGDICTDGQCVVGCRDNSTCPTGLICNLSTLMCETPPPQCTIDSQCPSGKICTDGQCVTGCRVDSDCSTGEFCDPVTLMCEIRKHDCTSSQGFWKNHTVWPTETLKLGNQIYTKAELLVLLQTPVRGDASMNLAHELIAALLSEANGASSTPAVDAAITDAQNRLATFSRVLPYDVRAGDSNYNPMIADAATLQSYNTGTVGPGECEDNSSHSSSLDSIKTTVTAAAGGCDATGNGVSGSMITMVMLALSMFGLRVCKRAVGPQKSSAKK